MKPQRPFCILLKQLFGSNLQDYQFMGSDQCSYTYIGESFPPTDHDLSLFSLKRTSYSIVFATIQASLKITIQFDTRAMKNEFQLLRLQKNLYRAIHAAQEYLKFHPAAIAQKTLRGEIHN